MYERFTDRSRKVMQHTNQIIQHLGHEFVHAEHILLSLLGSPDTLGHQVLKDAGVPIKAVGRALAAHLKSADYDGADRKPTGKRIIEGSIAEARALGHNYVGTEHFLLALAREEEGLTAAVFRERGLSYEATREHVLARLRPSDPPPTDSASL